MKKFGSEFVKKYGIILVLIFMWAVMLLVSPSFRSWSNATNIFRQVSIKGIIALGMTFVILIGGIDLTVGSQVAVAGVIAGSILVPNPNMVFPAVLAAIVVCSAAAAMCGVFVAYLNVPPFISTLAGMTILRGVAYVYSNGTPYILKSEGFKAIGTGYTPIIIFVVLAVIMHIILSKTKFGRHIYAVGGNKIAAAASGIKVPKIWIEVYAIAGVLAGIAGVVLAARTNSGQPAVGVGYETDVIAAVAIGGTSMSGGVGTIIGSCIGMLIIGTLQNGMNLLGVSSYWQDIVKGAIIIAAVCFDTISHRKSK